MNQYEIWLISIFLEMFYNFPDDQYNTEQSNPIQTELHIPPSNYFYIL